MDTRKRVILSIIALFTLLIISSCSQKTEESVMIDASVKNTLINEYLNTEYCPFIVYNGNIYYSYLKSGKSVEEVWKPLSEATNKENAYFEILDTDDFGKTTVYTFENKSLTMFLTDKNALEEKLYVAVNYSKFPDFRADEIEEIRFVNAQGKNASEKIVISEKSQVAVVLQDIMAASQKNVCEYKGTSIPENASNVYEVQIVFKHFGAAYIFGSAFTVNKLWKISSNEVVPESAINMSKESQIILSSKVYTDQLC